VWTDRAGWAFLGPVHGIGKYLALRQELSRPPFCLALESAAEPITLLQVKK
jgi:hypothetical protein